MNSNNKREIGSQSPTITTITKKRIKKSSPRVFILVLGYYGNHPDMTWNTLRIMIEKVIDQVENEFKVDWADVVWLCSCSTWMSMIPVFLYLRGLGSGIELYPPCELSTNGNRPRFLGDIAKSLNTSHDHMEKRIREGQRQSGSNVADGRLMIRTCIQQGGSIQHCDGWKEQRQRMARRATHFIHLPHIDPDRPETQKDKNMRFWSHGGQVYQQFKGPKARFDVYDCIRTNKLHVPSSLKSNATK